jgi:XapX domain-containing protein
VGGRLVEIAATGQREVSFDLIDFCHNESRLFGVDTLKHDLTASAKVCWRRKPRGLWRAITVPRKLPRPAGWARRKRPAARSQLAQPGASCCGRRNREAAMTGYLVSLLMGLAVGVVYGLVQVRSPAPPLIALVGLLGMVLGEQAIDMTKHHLAPPAQISIRQALMMSRGLPSLAAGRTPARAGYRPSPASRLPMPWKTALLSVPWRAWGSRTSLHATQVRPSK